MNWKALLFLILALPVWFTGTARAADPEDAKYNVVVTLYNAGQWQAALKLIEEREKLNLSDTMRAKYLAAKGLVYERGSKPTEAHAAYEQLLAKYPQAPETRAARIALIHLDYEARHYGAVIKDYPEIDKSAVDATEKKNLALMDAEALYTKDDAKAALAAYDTAIALGTDKNAVAGRLFDLYSRLQMNKELVAISAGGIAGMDPDLLALARAEALLTLGRNDEAGAEAAKVGEKSQYYPRASFARGLALIRAGKLKEAVGPLTVALQTLKDPPPPPSAYLTLADCLLESGRTNEVEQYVTKAEKLAAKLPEAEREPLLKQITLVKLRETIGSGSRKEMIATITQSRDSLPKDQLSRLLYMRLFALSEEGDDDTIVQTMAADYPIFQAAPEDGPATLIYYASLRKLKRQDEALKLLADFIQRKPNAPEAIHARLGLANIALEKQEFDKAMPYLDAIRSAAGAEATLGKETFQKVLFNRAVAADKLNKPDEAIQTLTQLIQATPANPLLGQADVLLGQLYAVKSDYPNAAASWKKALGLEGVSETDVHDRLGRVLYAAKDYAGAGKQFEAEAKLIGGTEKLSRESAEAFARARFSAGQFAESAGLYEELHKRFHDPVTAYECAVALERDKKMAEAAKWYAIAQKSKDQLPPEYAKVVDANLANAQMQSGSDDQSAHYWLESLTPQTTNTAFEAALVPLRKMAGAGKLNAVTRKKVESSMADYGPSQPRYYALGALLLQGYSAEGKTAEMGALAEKLATEFSTNESKLDPKSSGATLAPAIIFFFKGEAERLGGNPADALGSYETILSAYPYNEWPDAAAYGAAECYATLGDKPTALAKFNEVVKAAANSPASARWGELARKRITELNKGQ